MRYSFIAAALAVAQLATAQTFTSCDPTKKSALPSTPLIILAANNLSSMS
jgi:hypothetical protein